MKNIKNFSHHKYSDEKYKKIEEYVYEYATKDCTYFCTPISFEQEPKFEEGKSSKAISQYPLEDILDKFNVWVSDFFQDLNNGEDNVCYYEFSALKKQYILDLKNSIIGKHVYNKTTGEYIHLIIE